MSKDIGFIVDNNADGYDRSLNIDEEFGYNGRKGFYLDEYPEQEELREEWLRKWHNDINLAEGLIELFKEWLKND